MALRFRDLSAKEVVSISWPFMAAVGIGIGIRLWYPCDVWPHETAYALADAFIVAGVIGIVLELAAAKFLIQKVSDELAEKLIGRGLPPELQSEIKKIVDTDIVRDHYVKRYRFADAQGGKIVVESTITYEVRNYSDAAREYSPFIQEEVFYEPEFLYMEYGIGRKMYTYREQEIAAGILSDPNTSVKTFKGPKKVRLEPIRNNEKSVCTVQLKYKLVMPEEYTDITNFGGPTIGATIIVDRKPGGYDVVAGKDDNIRHEEKSDSWYFERPFIAGQQVRIWWFRSTLKQDGGRSKNGEAH